MQRALQDHRKFSLSNFLGVNGPYATETISIGCGTVSLHLGMFSRFGRRAPRDFIDLSHFSISHSNCTIVEVLYLENNFSNPTTAADTRAPVNIMKKSPTSFSITIGFSWCLDFCMSVQNSELGIMYSFIQWKTNPVSRKLCILKSTNETISTTHYSGGSRISPK